MGMKNYILEVYTRPTCSDCQDLKKFLKDNRISHTEYDLSQHPEKEKDLVKVTGNGIVPGLVFSQSTFLGIKRKTESMIGFEQNRTEIKEMLSVS